tara:strand:+ start:3199 stop:3963 length:765 start_codon:yes stop_codon:yes gene_type:complete
MAGEAKTTNFMLGTATVMFGPQADVFDLTPEEHGVGMTKNVSVTTEPAFTDLTQGVKNSIVYSVMTGNTVRAALEVYEYTAANMLYAQGLDGSTHVKPTGASTLASPVVADDTTIDVQTGEGADFNTGDYIVIEHGAKDKVYVRKVVSVATDVITIDEGLPNAIPAGEVVRAGSLIQIGSKADQPFLGCKIVGTTAEGEAITMIFPKVRVTNGFNLQFSSDDFQNMPFELTMYDLVTSDPQYATFQGAQGFAIV